jgi:FlaA1/EpsC-like NDP-sugar epimerase
LDMGEPVRVVDLAHDLIRLSGYKPDDIEVVFSGVRPGEKLFEELSLDEERASRTRHPKVFIGKLKPLPYQALCESLDALTQAALSGVREDALARLKDLVPEYQPGASLPPPRPAPQDSGSSLVAESAQVDPGLVLARTGSSA